jgi:peptide/nickel transport system ATP-binding protein
MNHAVLEMEGFNVDLGPAGRRVRVVDDLSLTLRPGRITCLVGESGSGKSVTAMALMRLLPAAQCAVSARTLRFEGADLAALGERGMARLRGDRMAMIFQEPMTSLNPVFTIGEQVGEALRVHRGLSAKDSARTSAGGVAAGADPRARAAAGCLSARALRRHAPARDDRHGAGLRAGAADRG